MATDPAALEARLSALETRVAKAKGGKGGKGFNQTQPRHPAGSSLGGQWKGVKGAIAGLFQSAGFAGFGAKTLADPNWSAAQSAPSHVFNRPGSAKHPHRDDKGREVFIHRPKTPTPAAQWANPNSMVTVTPGADRPPSLNGIPFAKVKAPADWAKVWGQNPGVEAGLPDLAGHKHKYAAAGVIVTEKDGRVWLTSPTGNFGGYRNTFPKGTQEPGLTLQQTAIKEAWEETGLKVRVIGVLGDFERTTSVARYYLAERIGGDPSDMGWESQALRLAPRQAMKALLNMPVDRNIMRAMFDEEDLGKSRDHLETGFDPVALAKLRDFLAKAKVPSGKPGAKQGHWNTQPRWPAGTPLGGQWKKYDGNGILEPPHFGTGKAAEAWALKAKGAYDAAAAGDYNSVLLLTNVYVPQAVAKGWKSAGGNEKGKFKLAQYVEALYADKDKKTAAVAKAETLAGPPSISAYKKTGAKPGGSNPGGVYTGPDGAKYLVKGANYPSDDRAKNEVLASKLMQAAGVAAPDMHLVNLEGQYGGGLGVAAKMETLSPWSKADKAHLNAAQADFAVHAWLANYDAVGLPAGDNLAMVGGKVFNYDPGGALLYRAQGLPKAFKESGGKLGATVHEWDSMRNKTVAPAAHSVYGSMSGAGLQESAKKLQAVSDKTIKDLVKAYGPGNDVQKQLLANTLIARRDDILVKAGLKAGSGTPAAPKAVEPPKPAEIKPQGQSGAGLTTAATAAGAGAVLHTAHLTNTEPGHNKFYTVTVVKDPGGKFVVRAKWGKIGASGTEQVKGIYETQAGATNAAQMLTGEKMAKGYIVDLTQSAAQPDAKLAGKLAGFEHAYGIALNEHGASNTFVAAAKEAVAVMEGAAKSGMVNALDNNIASAKALAASGSASQKDMLNALAAYGEALKVGMGPAGGPTPAIPASSMPATVPAGFTATAAEKGAAVINYAGVSVTFPTEGKTEGHQWIAAAANVAAMHAEGNQTMLQAAADTYAAAKDPGAGMQALASFSQQLADKWMDDGAVIGGKGKFVLVGEANEAVKALGHGDGAAHQSPMDQLNQQVAQALIDGDAAGFKAGQLGLEKIAHPWGPAEQSSKDMALAYVAHWNSVAQQTGQTPHQVSVGQAPAAATTAGTLPKDQQTPKPKLNFMGNPGLKNATHLVAHQMSVAGNALSVGNTGLLQHSYDKLKEYKSAYKLGSNGSLKVSQAMAWVVANAKEAGLTIEGGQFKGAAVKADVMGQATVMLDRVGLTPESIIGSKVVTGLQAMNSGDDKGLATIIGGLALDGSVPALSLAEKLTAMAESKGGFPMATGAAATIISDPSASVTSPKVGTPLDLPPAPPKPQFQAGIKHSTKPYYDALAEKMDAAYAAGDLTALLATATKKNGSAAWPMKDGQPSTMNGALAQSYHTALVTNLTAAQGAKTQADLDAPVVAPSPGQNTASLPAMPKFDDAKIGGHNTNAAAHNAKVDAIAALAAKADVKGILALNFATNTYGKKQAKLANDALAAMGSPFTVDPGQKKHSHAALTGGVTAAAVAKSGALTDKELPPKLDFMNWNGAGKGLSSKPALNAANQKDFDALTALAKAGDVNGIKNYQFDVVTADGTPTGAKAPIGKHPSQHVKGHYEYLLQAIDEKLNPPKPLEIFEAKMAAASIAKLSEKFPPKPLGVTHKKVPSSQTIGHYIALGQVKGHEHLVPKATKNFTPQQVAQANADWPKWKNDSDAQAFRSAVQGHGGHEYHGGWDSPSDTASGSYGSKHTGATLTKRAKAAHKWARKQPAGTKIYKWENLSADAKAKLEKAQPGLIIQNPAPACASRSETNTKGFGSSHRWTIIFTEGAKGLNSFSSGSHSGEQEVTLLPNHRFMILEHKKSSGYGYAETTVLLLPPDPALDSDGYGGG